ncbi:MAG: hypothetical protein K0B84_04660 [Firmicutes bacterium]|nr:hypothetical protein [Bacillota bacterium]
MEAELNESKTAALLFDKLPISGIVNTWGDEIYFPPCSSFSTSSTSCSMWFCGSLISMGKRIKNPNYRIN